MRISAVRDPVGMDHRHLQPLTSRISCGPSRPLPKLAALGGTAEATAAEGCERRVLLVQAESPMGKSSGAIASAAGPHRSPDRLPRGNSSMRLSLLHCFVIGCLSVCDPWNLGSPVSGGQRQRRRRFGCRGRIRIRQWRESRLDGWRRIAHEHRQYRGRIQRRQTTIPWREIEGISPDGNRSYLYDACAQLNQFWGSGSRVASITQASSASTTAWPSKGAVRELGGNSGNVGRMFSVSIGCFSDYASAMGSIVYSFGARNDKTKAEFKARSRPSPSDTSTAPTLQKEQDRRTLRRAEGHRPGAACAS